MEAYLHALGQDYVTDSTNADDAYTRNRIRHEVVPVLRQINPAVSDAAARLSALLRQDEDCLAGQAQDCLAQAAQPDGAWCIAPLRAAHPAVRTRALRCIAAQSGMPLRDFSARHVEALVQLLESGDPSAACTLPHGFAARRNMTLFGWKSRKTRQTGRCVRSPSHLTGLCGRGGCTSR